VSYAIERIHESLLSQKRHVSVRPPRIRFQAAGGYRNIANRRELVGRGQVIVYQKPQAMNSLSGGRLSRWSASHQRDLVQFHRSLTRQEFGEHGALDVALALKKAGTGVSLVSQVLFHLPTSSSRLRWVSSTHSGSHIRHPSASTRTALLFPRFLERHREGCILSLVPGLFDPSGFDDLDRVR
jgi:hypothetical protein